ncbi:endonuclease/exonuclease/phosphatase family protein [Myroides odoratimimus]|uniref:endonuclease/exonuclease/phosphatase family protein n=1 Tax=Myroides odoratimimus TaxID=76832 RepID=UPI003100C8C7
MKIVTWNCNGAFRNKFKQISSLNADIFIIQECENPMETNDQSYKLWAKNYTWIGENKNKGLAIFAKPNIKLQKLNWSNQFNDHTVNYFLPCKINDNFNLLAVWAHYNNSPNFGYIGQIWKYIQINKNNLNNSIIAGDFNSNAIWDQWDRWWNHSDVINELKEIGINSLYHHFHQELQGQETKPTFFLQRKQSKPYHIDYILGSENFINKTSTFEIADFYKWIEFSDHMPIIYEY